MFPRVAGPRRLALLTLVLFTTWTLVLWLILPYDNPFLLFLQFTAARVQSLFRHPVDDERLLLERPGQFPFTDDEVAYIVKTGYGTQYRVPALLEASRRIGTGTRYGEENILVVGDFAGDLLFEGRRVAVRDMVAAVMEDEVVLRTPVKNVERMNKYGNMTLAIQEGRKEEAESYSKAVGWELDALKVHIAQSLQPLDSNSGRANLLQQFIPSLALAWKELPGKRWYIMQDDDTFILRPSLYRFLEHLDPSKELYLGNAIGDYKGRFAHGGSSFILSNKAMSRLLDDNPDVVSQAYVASLDEIWGDKLVATTLMKVGVYLSERYGHFFNGERPLITKIAADRLCSPLISFHGLARPEQMVDVGKTFATIDKPVFWRDLWRIYEQPSLDALEKEPIRVGRDHVGSQGDPEMVTESETADECMQVCEGRTQKCLAWTWEHATRRCVMSPWVIVGEAAEGKSTGLNVPQVKQLDKHCGRY